VTDTTTNEIAKLDREQINSVVSFDEAIAQANLTEDQLTYVASPYTVLKDREKETLVNVPFFIRGVRFAHDESQDADYAVVYVVSRNNEMFIFTDGSTGIYKQLLAEVARRANDGHPTPAANIMVANGLRVSEYFVNETTGEISQTGGKGFRQGATYYLG
jgi:hypothetical protein